MHTGLPGGQGRREGVDYGLGGERAIKKNKISHRAGVFEVSDYCHFCFFTGPESFVMVVHNFQGGHESKESHYSGK